MENLFIYSNISNTMIKSFLKFSSNAIFTTLAIYFFMKTLKSMEFGHYILAYKTCILIWILKNRVYLTQANFCIRYFFRKFVYLLLKFQTFMRKSILKISKIAIFTTLCMQVFIITFKSRELELHMLVKKTVLNLNSEIQSKPDTGYIFVFGIFSENFLIYF